MSYDPAERSAFIREFCASYLAGLSLKEGRYPVLEDAEDACDCARNALEVLERVRRKSPDSP